MVDDSPLKGRFPANIILDEEAARLLDEQSGELKSGSMNSIAKPNQYNTYGKMYERKVTNSASKGGASRFYKIIEQDDFCELCFTQKRDTMKVCQNKNKSVQSVKKSGKNINQIKEHTVQQNATQSLNEKSVQLVKYVGNLCPKCATSIVQELVRIKNLASKNEESQAIQGFIVDYRKCILIQNLANYVEQMDNIDTTPTTQNLLRLFGYVLPVIKNYIRETEKSVSKRFLYQAKASKAERNAGCEGLETKQTTGGGGGIGDYKDDVNSASGKYGSEKAPATNNHPTVKPLKLMEYLCTLTKTPTGGIVLDPFAGSGSTCIAAKRTGRDFIGIEKEQEYCKIAEARLRAVQKTLL